MLADRTILIADNAASLTRTLSRFLRQRGATPIVAANGLELCAMAEARLPDLIISDYQMPLLDGLAACAKLCLTPATAKIPAILLTGRGKRISLEALSHTNVRFLHPKPLIPSELMERADAILAHPRASHGTSR